MNNEHLHRNPPMDKSPCKPYPHPTRIPQPEVVQGREGVLELGSQFLILPVLLPVPASVITEGSGAGPRPVAFHPRKRQLPISRRAAVDWVSVNNNGTGQVPPGRKTDVQLSTQRSYGVYYYPSGNPKWKSRPGCPNRNSGLPKGSRYETNQPLATAGCRMHNNRYGSGLRGQANRCRTTATEHNG